MMSQSDVEDSIEQTDDGIWVIKGETHLNPWIREAKRLDHDRYLIPIACSFIRPKTLVIDVGASIGDHTVAYLRTVGPDGMVIAYEPNTVAFECLERNCPKAVNHRVAVGRTVGKAVLKIAHGNVGMSHLTESESGETVELTTLDADLDEMVKPLGWEGISLIKIDVEGCEPDVIIGAEKLIDRYRPVIILEVNKVMLALQGYSPIDVWRILTDHDYRTRLLPDTASWDQEGQFDVLCLPS